MIHIIETKERFVEDNNLEALRVNKYLNEKHVFFVNLMASPGAGKTTLLVKTIEALKKDYRIGVLEADVDSSIDAETVEKAGAIALQAHTGGSCHMDADMTYRGLLAMDLDHLDVIFLENVGNLVCPAEFDVGAHKKVMILSVPEGDDKPLKYPLMFTISDCLLINKIDTKPVFDFDETKLENNVRKLNEKMPIYSLSALTGEGMKEWVSWLKDSIEKWRTTL